MEVSEVREVNSCPSSSEEALVWFIHIRRRSVHMNPKLIIPLALTTSILTACSLSGFRPDAPEPAASTLQISQSTPASPLTETPTPAATDTSIPVTESSVPEVSFAKDVMPIFEAACIKCHGVEEIKEGLDMRTYEGIMAGSFNGPVIVPGNADESFLVQQLIDGEMPKQDPKLTGEQIQIISGWVDEGALNN